MQRRRRPCGGTRSRGLSRQAAVTNEITGATRNALPGIPSPHHAGHHDTAPPTPASAGESAQPPECDRMRNRCRWRVPSCAVAVATDALLLHG